MLEARVHANQKQQQKHTELMNMAKSKCKFKGPILYSFFFSDLYFLTWPPVAQPPVINYSKTLIDLALCFQPAAKKNPLGFSLMLKLMFCCMSGRRQKQSGLER